MTLMSLVVLILGLGVVGVVLWAVCNLLPMPAVWQKVIVVIAVLLWLIQSLSGGGSVINLRH